MLRKLFKYEFGATGRVFLPMYAALLVMSVIARLFYTTNLRWSEIATALVTMVMLMLFTAVWVVTLVIIIRRFSSNLLGREGYLMHVLPVNPWEHVLAKSVTSGVWVIAGMIVSAAAFFIMLFGLTGFWDISLRDLFSGLSEATEYLRREGLLGQTVLFILQLVLLMIVSFFEFILSVYAAMSIGQLANSHRVWASIGAYFGLNIVQSFIFSLLSESDIFNVVVIVSADGPVVSSLASANRLMALFLLLSAAVCVVLFFVSSILLKKKLNLQ